MDNFLNNIKGYLSYKTNYFESFSEFISVKNDKNNNYVNVLCCKIRSINSNFDELILFLENGIYSKTIDLIVLTETWHDASIHCNYEIDGYNLFFSTIKRNQNDGIMVFVKHTFNVNFFEYDCIETNILKLSLVNLSTPINMLCIYRSPSSDERIFLKTLSKVIDETNNKDGYTVLIGDMNINILSDNAYNNEYLDLLSKTGFASFINIYTRVPVGLNHSCLDHIFINSNDHLINSINAGVLQTYITDHYSTCVSIPTNVNFETDKNTFTIIHHDKIKNLLSNEKWISVYDKNNVNECFNEFYKIISNIINKSTTSKIITSKNRRLKEWMTPSLLRSTRHKQSLFLKCKKNPNNLKLNMHYTKYKNTYTTILRLAKLRFYEKKFNSISHNSKLTWKLINEITCSKINNKEKIQTLKIDEKLINVNKDPKEASNIFNNFFFQYRKEISRQS
jgi:hypothetical protein